MSKQNRAGFTLIEILVVIVIVAIITAVAVLAFGGFGRERREKIITEQFANTITVAQQQAILTPVVLGLGISEQGYGFYQFQMSATPGHSDWKPLHDDVLSNVKAFGNVFKVRIKSIDTFSAPVDKDNHRIKPAILFLPSGYVTPFELALIGKKHTYLITVKNNGVTAITSSQATTDAT